MAGVEWLKRRNRGIHMTIRDVDCEDFDAEAMAREFARLKVTFFSFFAGGYVTTYPTDLDLQRVSPWLGDQDITGEIVEAAHRHGIRAFPMLDLGALPNVAFEAHPEWPARNADGTPRRATPYTYCSCPMGGWVREYSRQMVREICERYDVDGMKFGGGSYGFGRDVCHCEACRQGYRRDTGQGLPNRRDWSDPAWRRYVRWREEQTVQCVAELVQMVHSIRPGLPVVGNSVCFGDPGWTVNSSLDIERLAELEDIVQVEIQTRFWFGPEGSGGDWQYLRWPAETANYMTTVSDRPVWAVASYFAAWPWRRNAAPPVEQKVYLAQVAAHGGHPMVNLSGGPPAVHEDKRGFAAMESLFSFMDEHQELYGGDSSPANAAIVYSQATLMYYGNDRAGSRYVNDLRGFEQALNEAHIPYDITSTRRLDEDSLSRYEVLIVPSMVCMNNATAERLRAFVEGGGGLIADFETGTRDEFGESRERALLAGAVGFQDTGQTEMVCGEGHSGPVQGYMRVHHGQPLSEGMA
ncbi:MAG: family 10 glycosylhydrolase, partial [Candidatus Brocadiia bacterium]